MTHEVRDLDDGLWIWRLSYPDWHERAGRRPHCSPS